MMTVAVALRVVVSLAVQRLVQGLQALGSLGVIPFQLAGEEPAVVIRAERRHEDIFKFMTAETRFVFGNRQGRNVLGL